MSVKRYLLLAEAYIGNRLCKAGEFIRTEIEPGPHMREAPEPEESPGPPPPAPPVQPLPTGDDAWPFFSMSDSPPEPI